PGPVVHDRDVRGHAGGADAVGGGADDAGHVGAVAALVDVHRIDAGGRLTRPIEVRDVHRPVAGQRLVEVRGDVRGGGVDAGVDDPDRDPSARGLLVGRGGADLVHVPLLVGQRVGGATLAGVDGRRRGPGAGPLGQRRAFLGDAVLHAEAGEADRVVAGGPPPPPRVGRGPGARV